jgi:hypothetical protein
MLRFVVWYKFADVLEVLAASIIIALMISECDCTVNVNFIDRLSMTVFIGLLFFRYLKTNLLNFYSN